MGEIAEEAASEAEALERSGERRGIDDGGIEHVTSIETRDADGFTHLRNVCSCGWKGKWRPDPVFVRVDPETGHDLEAL